jgi:hypothetical protein
MRWVNMRTPETNPLKYVGTYLQSNGYECNFLSVGIEPGTFCMASKRVTSTGLTMPSNVWCLWFGLDSFLFFLFYLYSFLD